MDLISTRTIDITKLALDGLMMRQKAVTANIANVMTPDYQRKEVSFEGQLREIIEGDNLKQTIKTQNSIQYNPTSLESVMGTGQYGLTPQEKRYMQTDLYSSYNPQIVDDIASGSDQSGNNVDLEKEVMSMTSIGMRYNVLAGLEAKALKNIAGVIKGDMG